MIVQRLVRPTAIFRAFPFDTAASRSPLQITLHEDAASPLLQADADAVAMLREFAEMEELDIIDTRPGHPCSLEFKTDEAKPDMVSASVTKGDRSCSMGVWTSPLWPDMARRFTGGNSEEAAALLEQLIPLELSRQQGRNVFATNSSVVHKYTERFRDANIRTFDEALRLLALQLRIQDSFPWRTGHRVTEMMDRESFYSLSASVRMPALDKFQTAWARRAMQEKDESEYLGRAPHARCARALRALDEIGFEFFASDGKRRNRLMTYHFDYLTLLLAGALDAQGRMAHAIFDIKKPDAWLADFHKTDFLKALRAAGANHLVAAIERDRYRAIRKFLGNLRNTIHGVGLTELGVDVRGVRGSVLRVHGKGAQAVRQSALTLGGYEAFGLHTLVGTELEPYQCAIGLVRNGFEVINEISAAIQLDRPETPDADKPTQRSPLSSQQLETNAERRRRVLLMG